MEKKRKDSMLKKIFLDKKGWIWLLVLLVGTAVIGCALKIDCCLKERKELICWEYWPTIRFQLWQASEMVCNVVVAYSTMLAAVVIFYYSVTENKCLGVPYRRLIAYTVGSLTIPILFMVTLLLTVFMVIARYMPWKHTMYVCAIYILLLQTCMIVEILRSTSYDYGKRVICREERKNYGKKMESGANCSMIWVYFTGRLEQAIHSDEIIQDKKELLEEFLRIPFQTKKGRFSRKNFCQKVFEGKEEWEKIYQFYFSNISSAFQNLDGGEKGIERNELHLCIGGFLKELYECLEKFADSTQDDRKKEVNVVYHMVLSGIMNGMIYSDAEDAAVFCDYIFSECIPDELSTLQLCLYVLFQEVMYMLDKEPKKRQLRIKKLTEWKFIKTDEDISICADFWDIWVRVFDISPVYKMKHFKTAMRTVTGHSSESEAVLEMILPMETKQ